MEKLFETLVWKLRRGIVSFVYRKKDGTERHACGTLYGIGHTIKGTSKHHQYNYTFAYYDVDCKGWRSFIIENLVEVGELRQSTIDEWKSHTNLTHAGKYFRPSKTIYY